MSTAGLDSYSRSHRHPLNLLIHIATVPVVYVSAGILLVAPMMSHWETWWAVSVALIVYSALMQRFGHRLESYADEPRTGFWRHAVDWIVEQFVLFPNFLLSGGWIENWRRSQR
jgi:hypothetical protein